MNPYAYAGSNPVINADPSGLFFQPSGLISLNDDQLSMAHVGYELPNMSIEYSANKFMTNQNNYNNYSSMQAMSFSTTFKAAPLLGGIALADGPLPFGEVISLVGAVGLMSYDIYQNWNSPAILNEKKDTLKPGPNAGESIPARDPERGFTKDERDKINEIGQDTGCRTCGGKNPETKTGNFIPDHQPPNALNPTGSPQRLLPHCINCSRVQGGQIRGSRFR